MHDGSIPTEDNYDLKLGPLDVGSFGFIAQNQYLEPDAEADRQGPEHYSYILPEVHHIQRTRKWLHSAPDEASDCSSLVAPNNANCSNRGWRSSGQNYSNKDHITKGPEQSSDQPR